MGKPQMTMILRGSVVLSYLTAAILTFFSNQTVDLNSCKITARYDDWSGFVFVAIVNCLLCAYNALVLIMPDGSQLWKTIVVLDVLTNVLAASCLGVGWQTFWLMKNGNIHTGWVPICNTFTLFCNKTCGALSISSLGFFLSIWLLMSTLRISIDPLLEDLY